MAPYDHLLDNFDASEETKERARILKRQAQFKTRPGSGHELGSLTSGLTAACMQIASERYHLLLHITFLSILCFKRLNNTDVSKSVAQEASCLQKKDYDKVYNIIKTLLEENDEEGLSYHQLQTKYRIPTFETRLKSYIASVENELITSHHMDHQSDTFKGAVFFWICSAAQVCWYLALSNASLTRIQLSTLTDVHTFSHEHKLPHKKFVGALTSLNKSCSSLRQDINAHFSANSSPSKGIALPRQSPRKAAAASLPTAEEAEPVRRMLRSALAQDPVLKTSPVKRPPQPSPTKIVQPKTFRGFPQGKVQRELPNRDSPKKRVVQSKALQEDDVETGMEIDSTPIESPTKKRKVDTPEKLASRPTSPALRQQIRQTNVQPSVLTSPLTTNHTNSKTAANSFPSRKATYADTESSSDESVPEVSTSIRRHRPVYLDQRQWNARDPRLDKIWRKAEKAHKKLDTQRFEDTDITMGC